MCIDNEKGGGRWNKHKAVNREQLKMLSDAQRACPVTKQNIVVQITPLHA